MTAADLLARGATPGCSARPTPTSPPPSPAWPGSAPRSTGPACWRPTRRPSCSAPPSPPGPRGCGHVCLDLATVRQSVPAEVEGEADEVDGGGDRRPSVAGRHRRLAGRPGGVAPGQRGRGRPDPGAVTGRGVPLVLDGTLALPRALPGLRGPGGRRAAAPGRGSRPTRAPAPVEPAPRASSAFAGVFESSAEQRQAAEAGARGLLSVIVGGPGTGKTTTVATMLALLLEAEPRPTRIALLAPTGKAAARMGESIAALAGTLRDSGVRGRGGPGRTAGGGRGRPPSTAVSAGGPTAPSATTAPTRSCTTWSSSTRPRWCRCR